MQFDTGIISTTRTLSRVGFPQTTQLSGWLGGMDKSEVPFVYHHLRKGCILQLTSINTGSIPGNPTRHLMFSVNYGSYRLGILSSTMARKIQELKAAGNVYRLTISAIEKEKYLPPTAIELQLEWG
ncbi:MAG: hypothetical protein JKX84_03025 [Flavobacteriales bacterium]|nr:hypothetical protein [Flavobacteriales bacterium]